ncbi:MAG: peptide chain release factor 1 [Caldiserica bacterium CG02_land_8_20_14_3_00_36_38]|nr:peptide chain release factor 1 [Caldisericota bacterium]NCQ53296.1 peptide chain release factor 1 [Caldisericota bacterium]OIP12361.1 MAG: peptide chain release factor 1 [Caldisericum sp. CG2_30_36_11]PIV55923.1 MAG: peptide chain release factor 1 [Caldiserica bacterium CG02_land_8_20_14_3_00_36_38]PIX29172.1 MAG: peptide chain release factor 1 [Caldiserica bacterium CG_4_8_14_3_um_filter_35_18]
MINKLEGILKRYNDLSKKLSDPEVISNSENFKKYSREFREVKPVVERYNELKKIEQEILGAQELLNSEDEELKLLGKEEIEILQHKKDDIISEIKILLIPKDPFENKNIIMEIRAGVGGEEAALFVKDLFRMYMAYAENKSWKTELLDSHSTDLGGFKEIIFSISGKDVYKYLKYESGAHRVQRVPETEASGRIHTSTVTVAVLPEAEDVGFEINPDDLRIDVFHASGHGGQNVQKVSTAIRIVHKPTGIMVTCQDERSQLQNKLKAMRILRARLYDIFEQDKEKEIASARRAQIGRGYRNERIRTYNFPQGRVTDHRINLSIYNIQSIMEGNLDELINALIEEEQKEKFEELEE